MPFWTRRRPDPDVLTRLETVERKLKALDVEWSEMFEKFSRLHMRLSKRDARASGSPQDERSGNGQGVVNPLAARLLNPYGDR